MNIKWNADGYTRQFSFVHQYGEGVLDLIDAPEGSFVVDLGCGNGALTERLRELNPSLAGQVKHVLDNNKAERHIRGGMATREKYMHKKGMS